MRTVGVLTELKSSHEHIALFEFSIQAVCLQEATRMIIY